MTHSDARESWPSILTTFLTLEPLSLEQQAPPRPLVRRGGGVKIDDKGGDEEEGGIGGAQGMK